MSESTPSRRDLPVVDAGSEARRWLGVTGMLACSLCCLSIPGLAAALSVVGLGFFRNDRILFPAAMVFAAVVGSAFHHAWRRHGRAGPGAVGLAAVVGVLAGLRTPSPYGPFLMAGGVALLLVAAAWDWGVTGRCGAAPR